MITYYINFDGKECTVFESQITTLLNRISEKKVNVKLINFEKNIEYRGEDISNNFDTITLRKIKKGSFFEPFYLDIYTSQMVDIISKEEDEDIVLHCRGHFASYISVKVKEKLKYRNIKVIADIRGMVVDEYTEIYKDKNSIYRLFFNLLSKRIRKIEKYISIEADYIYCVTNELKKYLIMNYNINNNKIDVIPTCIETKINNCSVKKIDEIKGKFVVVYSGGAQVWQCPDKIMETFLKIKSKRKESFLLILSKNVREFEAFAKKHGIDKDDYKIISCKFNEVSGYLQQGDIALLLREDNRINNVASPTKFAEYMLNNLPVVLTKKIGDLDSYLTKYKVGIYIDEIEEFNIKLQTIQLEHCRKIVEDIYVWDKYIDVIIDNYDHLASKKNRG